LVAPAEAAVEGAVAGIAGEEERTVTETDEVDLAFEAVVEDGGDVPEAIGAGSDELVIHRPCRLLKNGKASRARELDWRSRRTRHSSGARDLHWRRIKRRSARG
jgi:hypothetical protein